MAHLYRFLGRILPDDGTLWEISGEELRHLRKVLRLSVGDRVEVFNGSGACGSGLLSGVEPERALVRAEDTRLLPVTGPRTALGIGALKPGFVDELLPSLTELGLSEIHVFLQDGVAKSRLHPRARERWDRILVNAAKQCRRNELPSVHCWTSLKELLKSPGKNYSQGFYLEAGSSPDLGEQMLRASGSGVLVLVGGEKGFSTGELSTLESSFLQPASMGPLILRAYTAAISAGSLLRAWGSGKFRNPPG